MPVGVAAHHRIGIFFKSPRPGEVKTRLVPPLTPVEAAELYRAFVSDTLALCRRVPGADLTLFHAGGSGEADPRDEIDGAAGLRCLPQQGVNLGMRMAGALDHLLADASAPVRALLIGTDSPDLPPDYIAQGFEDLERSDLVLGPAGDGGYYLVALKRPVPGLFEEIAWSTEAVYKQQVERAKGLGLGVAELPPWHDVDTIEDLNALRGRLATGAVAEKTASSTRRMLTKLASLK